MTHHVWKILAPQAQPRPHAHPDPLSLVESTSRLAPVFAAALETVLHLLVTKPFPK